MPVHARDGMSGGQAPHRVSTLAGPGVSCVAVGKPIAHVDSLLSASLLNDTDSGVGDQNQQNDQWLNKRGQPRPARFRRVFKAGQDERDDGRREQN